MLTAGHCVPGISEWAAQDTNLNFRYMGYVEQSKFPGSDYAKINATGTKYWDVSPWRSEVAYWSKHPSFEEWKPPIDADYQIRDEASSYVGEYICHSGITTGGSCGYVTALNVTETLSGGETLNHLTTASPLCLDRGDSGGPVFAANTALGIVSAGTLEVAQCQRQIFYVEVTEAAKALGVHVARNTTTTTSVREVLNGNPGWVTVEGNVTAGGPIGNVFVNVNFMKYEDGGWKLKETLHPTVTNGHYEVSSFRPGKGEWKVKTALQDGQGPFVGSEASEEPAFTIKDGYQFVNVNSGKCLDVKDVSVDNGASIQQYECLNPATALNQVFTLVPQGGFYYQLVSRNSSKCADVTGVSQSNGAWVQQWACVTPPTNNQIWNGVGVAGGSKFVAKHSGKCMDVFNSGTQNGATVVQWDCNGGANQTWTFKSVESGPVPTSVSLGVSNVLNGEPGLVNVGGNLDLHGYPLGNQYVNVNFQKYTGGQWVTQEGNSLHLTVDGSGHFEKNYWGVGQGKWRARAVYSGESPLAESTSPYTAEFEIKMGYRLVNKVSGKCLSIAEGSGANGAKAIQWDCSGNPQPGDGQVFTWYPMVSHWPYFQIRFNEPGGNNAGKCLDVTGVSQSDGVQLHSTNVSAKVRTTSCGRAKGQANTLNSWPSTPASASTTGSQGPKTTTKSISIPATGPTRRSGSSSRSAN